MTAIGKMFRTFNFKIQFQTLRFTAFFEGLQVNIGIARAGVGKDWATWKHLIHLGRRFTGPKGNLQKWGYYYTPAIESERRTRSTHSPICPLWRSCEIPSQGCRVSCSLCPVLRSSASLHFWDAQHHRGSPYTGQMKFTLCEKAGCHQASDCFRAGG